MKYDVTVTGLGDMALAFLDPAMEMRFVILFNDDAPAELAELAILHTITVTAVAASFSGFRILSPVPHRCPASGISSLS